MLTCQGPTRYAYCYFTLSHLTSLEPSDTVQSEDGTLPLSLCRARRANRRLPKRFRDMLPEPLLPLYPQDAEVLLQVNAPGANSDSRPSTTTASATPSSPNQSFLHADSRTHLAQLPPTQCIVPVTQKISFGLFRLYNEGSVPTSGDPEDHSEIDPLPTRGQESASNLFYPYPNENSWLIGDWYWNQGAQKSKQNFKKLVDIITSMNFRSEDLYHTSWAVIDHQLGSLGTAHDHSQATSAAADSVEWQEDNGWMQRDITISVPFSRCSLHPGPKSYTVSRFYRRSLISIICEALSDPIRCKSFRFEPYSLRWKHSCRIDDIGVYGELFSSQAFITAHRDLQDMRIDPTGCILPRRIVALMFWSNATQLTAFGEAKLWPLYVYFGNESKYRRCTPSANLCSHAAYFQTVCISYV